MRNLMRWCTGVAVLALSAAACSDDPALFLSGPAGSIASLQLSTSGLDLRAGESATLGAQARDNVGNPVAGAVTLAACDGDVTVADAGSNDQWASTATVTANALGESCVTASVGGITETVRVRMVPASIVITGPDTVLSGGPAAYSMEFYDANGSLVTAGADFTPPQIVSLSSQRLPVTPGSDALTFDAAGQQPGDVTLQVSTTTQHGIIVTADKVVTIVPGVFAGTLSAGTAEQGAPIVVTSAIAWDGDEYVTIGGEIGGQWSGIAADAMTDPTTGSLTFLVPWNLGPGDYEVAVINQGPGQIAEIVTAPLTVTAGTPVPYRNGFPGVNTSAAELVTKISLSRPLAFPVVFDDPNVTGTDDIYFTMDNTSPSASGNAGEIVVRITLDWVDSCGDVCDVASDEDFDIEVIDGAFTAFLDLDGATLAVPESTLFNFNDGSFYFVRYETFSLDGAAHTVIEWLGDGTLCSDQGGCSINGEI